MDGRVREPPARGALAAGPALVLLAAMVPPARPAVAVTLGLGWMVLRAGRRPTAITWAAVLPVAIAMTWPWILGSDVPLGEPACTDPLSMIAERRVVLAAAILALVAILARAHRSDTDELGLVVPAAWQVPVAGAGLVVLAAGGLWIGPAIARPFFGPLDFPVPLRALVPALVFGLANGLVEEIAYRGAMQAWLGRVLPAWGAIGFQGLVFGVVHAGPDVVALLPVHVALLTIVGIAGGVVRHRTGSIVIPTGVHVGADIALYVGLACRAAG